MYLQLCCAEIQHNFLCMHVGKTNQYVSMLRLLILMWSTLILICLSHTNKMHSPREELYGAAPLAALISGGHGQADGWSAVRRVEGPQAEKQGERQMMEERNCISPSASSSRVTHWEHETDLWPSAIMLRAWRRWLIGGWTGRALTHPYQLSIKPTAMTNDCRDKERERERCSFFSHVLQQRIKSTLLYIITSGFDLF